MQCRCEQPDKFFSGYHAGTQAFQMRGVHLAIDQLALFLLQQLYILNKSKFAGIALLAKHAFTKKRLPHLNAKEPAHQFAPVPCFGTMRQPNFVQLNIGRFHLRSYPCAILTWANYFLAMPNHFFKSFVAGKFKSIFF